MAGVQLANKADVDAISATMTAALDSIAAGVLVDGSITEAKLDTNLVTKIDGAYVFPTGGIPESDLAAPVQSLLALAATALQTGPVVSVNGRTGVVTGLAESSALTLKYTLPVGGITTSDLASAVVTSLGKADTALQGSALTAETTRATAAEAAVVGTATALALVLGD